MQLSPLPSRDRMDTAKPGHSRDKEGHGWLGGTGVTLCSPGQSPGRKQGHGFLDPEALLLARRRQGTCFAEHI